MSAEYKEVYTSMELNIADAADPTPFLEMMELELERILVSGSLDSDEQTAYFFETGLTKFVRMVLKQKYSLETCTRVNAFLRKVLDVIAVEIKNDRMGICKTLMRIFDDDKAFYLQLLSTNNDPMGRDPSATEMYARVPESKWASAVLSENVNYFGRIGGFDAILRRIQEQRDDEPCPLSTVNRLLKPLVQIQSDQYLALERLQEYLAILRPFIVSRLMSLSKEELKSVKKEDLAAVLKHLEKLLLGDPETSGTASLIVDTLGLDLALRCFNSSNMEKRLYGLQAIKDAVDAATKRHWLENSTRAVVSHQRVTRGIPIDSLIKWINDHEVLETLFGPTKHVQLIARSTGILNFLCKHNVLGSKDVDLLWDCAMNNHEVFLQAVFKLVGEMTYQLPADLIGMFSAKIRALPPKELSSGVLKLARDLIKDYKQQPYKLELMAWLWDFIMHDVAVSSEIIQQGLGILQEALRTPHLSPSRGKYLEHAVAALKDNISVPYALQLIQFIIDSFPEVPAHHPKEQTREYVVMWLESQHSIIDVFFKNMVEFKAEVKAAVDALPEEEKGESLNSRVLAGRLEYANETKSRLSFLTYLLTNCEETITTEQMDLLCSEYIAKAMSTSERDGFLRWLLNARQPYADNWGAVADDVSRYVYVEWLMPLDPVSMTKNAYQCLQRYFVYVNVRLGALKWVTEGPDHYPPLDFAHEVVSVTRLVGYREMWAVALEADSVEVRDSAIGYLIHLHDKLVPEVREDAEMLRDIRSSFVDRCMGYMMEFARGLGEASDTKSGAGVQRCLTLLKLFCSTIEADAGFKCPSHGSRSRGRALTLIIHNLIKAAQPPATFELHVHSNETLRDLRLKILDKIPLDRPTNANPDANDLLLRSQGVELRDDEDGSPTLNDKCFDDKQVIEVLTTQEDVGEGGTHLRSRVAGYDSPPSSPAPKSPGPPALDLDMPDNSEQLVQQLVEITAVEEKLAMMALRKSAWDTENAIALLFDESARITLMEEVESFETAFPAVAPEVDEMEKPFPSILLASNQMHMDNLFDLLNAGEDGGSLCMAVWDLLMSVPTNLVMLESIEALSKFGDTPTIRPNWTAVFNDESKFHLLYALQITDALLFPKDDEKDVAKRAKWGRTFLASGGFTRLYSIFMSDSFAAAEEDVYHKACVALMVKVIDFFLRGALRRDPETPASPGPPSPSPHSRAPPRSEFTMIIESFGSEFSDSLIKEMHLPSFTLRLVKLIWKAASQPNPDRNDGETVAYAFRLVVLCVLSESALLQTLYSFDGFVPFLECVLMTCPEKSVRVEASEGVYQLCVDVKKIAGSSPVPLMFVLPLLLDRMPREDDNRKDMKVLAQYFLLLARLLNVALDRSLDTKALGHDLDVLLTSMPARVRARPLVERRGGATNQECDEILVGYLMVMTTLCQRMPHHKQPLAESEHLITLLYHDCLFAMATAEERRASPNAVPPPKCKSNKSREVAFALLAELCSGCPVNTLRVLALVEPHHEGSMAVTSWDYDPAEEDKESGYVGLVNMGCTCYVNSLMQQFYMMPALRYGLMAVDAEKTKADAADALEDSVVYQIQKTFGYLHESEKAAFCPLGFCQAYKDWEGQPINPRIQQDVDEFFNLLCQRLEEGLKGTEHEKLLATLFGGKVSFEVRSQEKEFPYFGERSEEFSVLSLDIKSKKNLREALDFYVQDDLLDGENAYQCDEHNRKINATRRCCINSMSDTLIIHLKRFEFDMTSMRKVKLNDYVEFPTEIDMEPWTREGLARREAEEKGDNAEFVHRPDWYYQYELTGVLVHSGSADAGHYYSYIRARSEDPKCAQPAWFEFNDSLVAPFDMQRDLASECFGGDQWVTHWDNWLGRNVRRCYPRVRSAYLLVFERKARAPPSWADPLANVKVMRVSEAPEKAPRDEGASEYLSLLQKLPKQQASVPTPIYKTVWEENMVFLRDRRFFDEAGYFTFMLRVCQEVEVQPVLDYNTPLDPEETSFRMLRMCTLFVIEVLVHSRTRTLLDEFFSLLKDGFTQHLPACKWMLSLFCEDGALPFCELLFDCENEDVRLQVAELLIAVLTVLAPHERPIYDALEEIIIPGEEGPDGKMTEPARRMRHKSYVLRFMDVWFYVLEDSRHAWKRFKQYWLIVRQFALLGLPERRYLIQNHILELFIDYFMGQPRPGKRTRVPVMDKFALPDLTYFMDTLAIVVRGCKTGAPEPPPTTLFDEGSTELLELTESAAQSLFSNWFTSLLHMNYNPVAALQIVTHVSWNDPIKSTWVCRVMTRAIVSSFCNQNPTRLRDLLKLLRKMLLLDDSLQRDRIASCLAFESPEESRLADDISGLMAIVRHNHLHRYRPTMQCVNCLAVLYSESKECREFLMTRKADFVWITRLLQQRIRQRNNSQRAAIRIHDIDSDVSGSSSQASEATYNALATISRMVDEMPDPPGGLEDSGSSYDHPPPTYEDASIAALGIEGRRLTRMRGHTSLMTRLDDAAGDDLLEYGASMGSEEVETPNGSFLAQDFSDDVQ